MCEYFDALSRKQLMQSQEYCNPFLSFCTRMKEIKNSSFKRSNKKFLFFEQRTNEALNLCKYYCWRMNSVGNVECRNFWEMTLKSLKI